MKKAAVVILNWNGKHWLEKFIPKVLEFTSNPNFEIIVADNGSTDDSIAFLNASFPEIKQIILDKNYGFTGGYNKALRQVEAEYFVLLNSDIEPTENWLDILIEKMDQNEKVGACQPKILAYNNKNHFEYAGASGGFIDYLAYPYCRGRVFFTAEEDNGQYDTETEIFWATGACLIVRSKLYTQLNGLDDDFFAHMEEIDLCWRIQNLGFKIMVFPQSTVYHVGGGTLSKENPKKTFLNYRNNLALIFKNAPFPNNIFVVFQRMVLDGVAGFHALLKGEYKNTLAIIKAHLAFYAWVPSLLAKRKKLKSKKKLNDLQGTYNKSIVYQYFVKKQKTFDELN